MTKAGNSVIISTTNKEREVQTMRALKYEYNGVIYNTKAEAPEGATVKLVDIKDNTAKYNAKRVQKIRDKAKERKSA